jgi:DNA polymerase (family X)
VIEDLAGRLGRRARDPASIRAEPPVDELLDVDREYRERAAAGTLQRITPRRFNPRGEAWLPVRHTERAGRHYTALFSNSF